MKRNQEQTNETIKIPAKTLQSKNNVASSDLEDKIELERREVYIDPQAREIIRYLLQSGDEAELSPIYRCGAGYIYDLPDPANEKFNSSVPKETLLNLARLDILAKVFYEKVSTCPHCASINLTMHSRCPKCKSHNIKKTGLTEHIPCGYIDQSDKYPNEHCPKCGELLIEGQYRNMGRWYICQQCGDKFENTESEMICHSCEKNFAVKEVQLSDVPKFKLNPARLKEIRQNVASLDDIKKVLVDLGFSIEMPGLAVGEKSGMVHHFSLVAKRFINQKEIVIALDHAVSDIEIHTSPLILYIYKTSEIKVDIPIFVAMPKLSDTAKKIAQGHEILLIEGSINDSKTIKQIKNSIEAHIAQLTSSMQEPEVEQPQKQVKEKKSLFSKLSGK